MSVWYKTDVTRLSCGLLRAQSSSLFGFAALLLKHKLMRNEPPASVGVKLDSAFLPIELDEIPAAARDALVSMIDECSERSCSPILCHTSEFLGDAESYGANLLHESGKVWIAALWFRVGRRIESGYSICSQIADGTILTTTNLRRRSDIPPGMETNSYPGASLDELWRRHEDALRPSGEQTVVAFDKPQLLERLVDIRQRVRDFHLSRGILKPMTRSDVRRLDPSAFAKTNQRSNADETTQRMTPAAAFENDFVEDEPAANGGWRLVVRTALLGVIIGAVFGQCLLLNVQPPQDPAKLEIWPNGFHAYGWAMLFGLAGATIGFLRLKDLERPGSEGDVAFRPAGADSSAAPLSRSA